MISGTHHHRLPSLACLTTLMTGLFFTWLGLVESISGFLSRPLRPAEAFGGLAESVIFGLSFLMIAWLLWVRPRFGAMVLMLIGFAFAGWIVIGWSPPNDTMGWVVRSALVAVPATLGAFTFIRETVSSRMLIMR